jgi:hypothetical protein
MSHIQSHRGERILAMSVDNIGFLLDRLGQDCHPLQFLRELTQNGIEAIKRTGKPGQIIWDVDWTHWTSPEFMDTGLSNFHDRLELGR